MSKEFIIVIEVDNVRAAAAYNKAVGDWKQRSVFKGTYPETPECCYPHSYPFPPHSYTNYYKSIRQELQDLADIANAATSPYQMTEYQVKEMVKWENGRRIEEIMKEIK